VEAKGNGRFFVSSVLFQIIIFQHKSKDLTNRVTKYIIMVEFVKKRYA